MDVVDEHFNVTIRKVVRGHETWLELDEHVGFSVVVAIIVYMHI